MSRLKHHTPIYNDAIGAFGLPYHLEMISDNERVKLCEEAIKKTTSSDLVFCELGCGTGIFSIFAAKLCSEVFAVEIDNKILSIAKKNAYASKTSENIRFINADAIEVKLEKKCDVIFCEMMSIWLINEPQVPIINRARKELLAENGITIPKKIINLVELGNIDYTFGDIEIKASLPQFSGIRPPRIMTESRVASNLDFSKDIPIDMNVEVVFEALVPGIINCARLSSIVELAEGVNFYSTDTLMPVTIVPLKHELMVTPGDKIRFFAKYQHRSNVDDSEFYVERF